MTIPVRNVRAAPMRPLSERQLEVVRLLSLGQSNRQIARTLRCTVATVQWHIRKAALRIPGEKWPTVRLVLWYRGVDRDLLAGL